MGFVLKYLAYFKAVKAYKKAIKVSLATHVLEERIRYLPYNTTSLGRDITSLDSVVIPQIYKTIPESLGFVTIKEK